MAPDDEASSKARKSLLGAVLAAPEDDAPRLVYADWLTERGDPRGEFIQLQCLLGRSLYGARGYPLRDGSGVQTIATIEQITKRETALLKKHQKEWIAPIRSIVRTWTWKRGFVHSVVADAEKFFAGLDALFTTTPLFGADLTGFKKNGFAAFRSADRLASLRSLKVGQQRISAKEAPFLHSPHLQNLVDLDLWGNPLGDEGAKIVADARLTNLRSLMMTHTGVGAEGVVALANAEFFPRLESLHFDVGYDPEQKRTYGAKGVIAIAERGASLRVLSMTNTAMGDEAAIAIARSPALQNLRELYIGGAALTERGAAALAESPHLGKIEVLRGIGGYLGLPADAAVWRALRERFGSAFQG